MNDDAIRFRNISCSKMTENDIRSTSNLFSNNYGFWSNEFPIVQKRGKRICLSEERIRNMFVNKPDRFVALAYIGDELVGQIFYLKRNMPRTKKPIIWVLQLVVAENHRGKKIATKMMHSIWHQSNCYAWGLFTSNPMTISVLEKATMRKVDPSLIEKKLDKLRSVANDIFDDDKWFDSYENGMINTGFYTNHNNLSDRVRKVYPEQTFPYKSPLKEGYEWLAFTFQHQEPKIYSSTELKLYMDYSENALMQAYSCMDIENHGWAKHTSDEIDYLLTKYIKKKSTIIDVGCGRGRHTIELHNRGFDVHGIDFSEANIDYARKHSSNDLFEWTDIRKYETKKKYDVALCLYDVIGSFPNEEDNFNILTQIYKLLNQHGILIMSVMNMELTRKLAKKANIVYGVQEYIDTLLQLPASDTMQSSGNIFNGNELVIDEKDGVVYRKEQFNSEEALPLEYIVRDRRYTSSGISALLEKAGYQVDKLFYFSARAMSVPVDPMGKDAKEIFVVAHKKSFIHKMITSKQKMPMGWK